MNERAAPPRPTANVRAEEAVIGKIIGSAESFWSVQGLLKPEHFTKAHHRDIFNAIAKCCETGTGPTMSLLEAWLPLSWEGEGDVEPVLQILVEKAADVGSATDFVDEIMVAWRERERIAIARIAAQPKTFEETREALEARFRAIDDSDRVHHAIRMGEASGLALKRAAEAYENRGKRAVGIEMGIPEIDKIIGPMIPGTLVTIGAPSGHGKSALLSQIMRNNGGPSLDTSRINPSGFLSMEMSEMQNGLRNLASLTGIAIRKQITGQFNEKEYDELARAQRLLEQMPIYVQAKGRMTVKQAGNECRALARRYGVKLFGIDHLRLYEPEKEHWDPIRTIEYATSYNKALAIELDAVIIQLAQLTQESQKTGNWRFKDSSFYGGGMVKANSDIMLAVAVPIEWLRQNQPEPPSDENKHGREAFDKWLKDMEIWKEKAEFAALKVRDGATSQWKEIEFHGPRMLFGNIEREAIPF